MRPRMFGVWNVLERRIVWGQEVQLLWQGQMTRVVQEH